MASISTVRPYTKPNRPTLAADDRFITDNPATGIGATRWADFLNQLAGLVLLRTERNVAGGYAGIADDGLIDPGILRAALVPEEVADDAAKDALVIVAGDVGRRLVRVAATGILYLAKATGSGADKWIQFLNTPSASETIAGVAEIANDAEADAETDDARIMTSKKVARSVRRIVNPIAASRQPLLGLAYSDGVTSGRRIQWALGAAGALAGSPLSEVGHVFRVSASSGTTYYIASYNSSTTPENSHSLHIQITGSGALRIAAIGSIGAGDTRYFTWANFRTLYAGQWVRLDVVLVSGTSAPVVYLNGGDVSANFVASTAGSSPPDWMSSSLVATYRICGYNWPAGEFRPGVPINRALSASEIAQMVQTGSLLPVDRLGGSGAQLVLNSDFATYTGTPDDGAADTITSWTVGANIVAEAISGGLRITRGGSYVSNLSGNNLLIQHSAANPAMAVCTPGKMIRVRIRARVYGAAVGLVLALNQAPPSTIIAMTDSWDEYEALITPPGSGATLGIGLGISGGAAGEGVEIAWVRMWSVGALIQPEITRTAQLLDHGGNRIGGIATAGIRPLSDGDPVGIRGTQAATGYALGLGAADPLWFEPGLIRIIRVKPTASAVTNVTFRLNTSGGNVIGTVATSTLGEWVTLPFAAGDAVEVSAGDKLHITTDGAVDFEIDWSRR